jgi:taurine dioxygenase
MNSLPSGDQLIIAVSKGRILKEALPLLAELYDWQGQEAFQYRHRWQPGMLAMWDNRSVLHAATGGYQGHARRLHRTTIAAA